jgi:hypothetical protein
MKGPSRWVGRTSRAKWLAVAVLVLAVLALAVSGCSDEDVSVSETSLAPPDPRHASTFVPRTETQDGRTLLPLVFPDGTRVVASYPRRLRLSRLGIQPDVTYYNRRNPGARFALTFVHGPAEPGTGEFALRTRSWTILVPVRDKRQREVVQRNLRARQTGLGFPVIVATGPFVLSNEYGEGGGAMLAFGDRTPDPQTVSSLDPLIEMAPTRCRLPESEITGGYGAQCFGRLYVGVNGKRPFIKAVFAGLQFEQA